MNRSIELKLDFEHRTLALMNIARSCIIHTLSSAQMDALKRTESRWAGTATQEKCLVCGNGPSLDELDFPGFSGTIKFTANFFYKHAKGSILAPDFHVIVDSKIAKGIWPISMLDEVLDIFPTTHIFLNVRWMHLKIFEPYLDHGNIHWILPILYPHAYSKPRKRLDRPISGFNVVKSILSIATAMGYKKIGVVGVDGDGLFREIIDMPSHFYESAKDHAMRDFDSMIESLMLSTRSLWGWRGLVKSHSREGVTIQNLCKGGILDCMPRVSQASFLGIE